MYTHPGANSSQQQYNQQQATRPQYTRPQYQQSMPIQPGLSFNCFVATSLCNFRCLIFSRAHSCYFTCKDARMHFCKLNNLVYLPALSLIRSKLFCFSKLFAVSKLMYNLILRFNYNLIERLKNFIVYFYNKVTLISDIKRNAFFNI